MALQVVDAKKASYGVENATYAVVQLAQTTMRSELGKITLDKTFEERATLNLNIVESIRYGHVSAFHACCPLALHGLPQYLDMYVLKVQYILSKLKVLDAKACSNTLM